MANDRRNIECGAEAVAGIAGELRVDDNSEALRDAFRLSEKFPGELVRELWQHAGQAETIGITGPPGVGKSTTIPGLVAGFLEQDSTVGIIAVDPSSSSGGSIMGDRDTMMRSAGTYDYDIAADRGSAWIRSFSAAGSLGGVSEATLPSMLAFDVAGRDKIIVETVGVGQSELDISFLVDTTIVILQPGSGDSLQAMKSGLMEIPDILCINERDIFQPRVFQNLHSDLTMSEVPIVTINAATGEGIDNLLSAIAQHREKLGEEKLMERRRKSLQVQLAQLSVAYSKADIQKVLSSEDGERLLEEVGQRYKDPFTAAQELRSLL